VASVLYVAREGRPLAVAWADISFDAPDFVTFYNTSRGPGRSEDSVAVAARGGRQVELKAVTADEVTWAVSLNGREYPLGDGAVFLVRAGGGAARVTQVSWDVGGLPAAPETWHRLAGEIPEVAAFLAAAAGKE